MGNRLTNTTVAQDEGCGFGLSAARKRLRLPAIGADAGDFEGHFAGGEAAPRRAGGNRLAEIGRLHFLGVAAVGADQEEAAVGLAGMVAADKGIHALDTVDQAVLDQEVERPVDRRRRRAEFLAAQAVEQGVGADRLVPGPDQFENPPPQRRKAQAFGGAQLLRRGKRILDAVPVVVGMARGCSRFLHEVSDLPSRCSAIIRPVPFGGQGCPMYPATLTTYQPAEIAAALTVIQFNDEGLVPAIAQQHDSGEILMMAWMDRDAVAETMRSGRVCYWSRSRQVPWRKGDTSGHIQTLVELRIDCDGDTLLVLVDQTGVACHTGRHNCFFQAVRDGALQTIAPIVVDMSRIGKD